MFQKSDIQYTDAKKLEEKILFYVNYFSSFENVPYVWGGGALGIDKPSKCDLCRSCIEEKQLPIQNIFHGCKACQSCGIDCSHLVAKLYNKAGFRIPYGSTEELNKMSRYRLKSHYYLIDKGRNLAEARTGDLLLYDRHIVILVKNMGDGGGLILHSEDQKHKGMIGGITFEKKSDLTRMGRQKIRRILRHQKLASAIDEIGTMSSTWSPIDQHNQSILADEHRGLISKEKS
jgi:cell wall-associated NlpC family hydrolase